VDLFVYVFGFYNYCSNYFQTLGKDFAGRSTKATSNPIIVDTTPPIKTNAPIKINGRHITSRSEVSAWYNNK